MSTVLVYGDSNSFGTPPLKILGEDRRFDKSHRWPFVLAELLGSGVDVICEALPGRTTVHDDMIEGGGRNGQTVLPAVLMSQKPLDAVLLMLGTNDLKTRFSVSAWEIARSLERLIQDIRSVQPLARICVIAPVDVKEVGTLADVFQGAEQRQADLSKFIKEMALRADVSIVDANDYVTVSDIDGVHWDADMHVGFGRAMVAHVQKLLGGSFE